LTQLFSSIATVFQLGLKPSKSLDPYFSVFIAFLLPITDALPCDSGASHKGTRWTDRYPRLDRIALLAGGDTLTI
jgi:hypothetical protein